MITTMIAATLLLSPQQPQGPSKEILEGIGNCFKLLSAGKYMQALSWCETAFEKGSKDDKDVVGEFLGTVQSFVGEEEKAMKTFDGPVEPLEVSSVPEKSPLSDAVAEDAIKAIVREAKGRQIVILNEAHHVPRCRAFGLQLARALRKEGFEYFAAETFNKDVYDAWKKGYPLLKNGVYTAEPTFGDLERQAMKLGYKPVDYEHRLQLTGDQIDRVNQRETGEANNLIENVFKKNPKARVLIYCGYSHATENWRKMKDGRDYAWMAARIGKLAGLDPLTIDQTEQIPHTRLGAETPEYRYATGHGLVKSPTVFKGKDGKWQVFGKGWSGSVDMQVFHPRTVDSHGRESWREMNGYRKAVSIAVPASNEKVLVQAFVDSEPVESIPMDQVTVAPGSTKVTLMLPKGRYRIVLQKGDGTSAEITKLNV